MRLSKIAINLPAEERYFMQKWFQSWFDSPYYHILYKDRDNQEAEYFMDNLLEQIHLPVKSSVAFRSSPAGAGSSVWGGFGEFRMEVKRATGWNRPRKALFFSA